MVHFESVVREVCKIFDEHVVYEFRITNHQVRRSHLVKSADFFIRKLFVNFVVRLVFAIKPQYHSEQVAEQRYRSRMRQVCFLPFVVRGRRIIIKQYTDHCSAYQGKRIERKIDRPRNHFRESIFVYIVPGSASAHLYSNARLNCIY